MKRSLLVVAALMMMMTAQPHLQGGAEPVAKDATVYGFRIHYLEAGTGAPVILLHGTGGEGARWMPAIRALAGDFRVIAIDQIGFGQSDKPLTNYHNGVFAEFLAGFMKAIGLPRASIVGQSLGGSVAAYFAVHYPQMIDRLVVVSGGGFRSNDAPAAPSAPNWHARQIANSATLAESREYLKLLYYDDSRITDEMVETNMIQRLRSAHAISSTQLAGERGLGVLTEADVRRIAVPTLVVWGRNDELANPSGADRLHGVIPGSRVVLLDRAGHYPFLEQPEEFNRIVKAFLGGDN